MKKQEKKGAVYILKINVKKPLSLKIGKLGKINFKKGTYVYVGSAQKNFEQRIKRHLSRNKKKFWHIDYLLENKNVEVTGVFYKKAGKQEECLLAREISKKNLPIEKFGCSDCNCQSHLFFIKKFYNKNMKPLVIK